MIAALGLWFRTNPRNVWLIAGLLALALVAGGLYLKGRHDADRKNEAARAVAVAEALKTDNIVKERTAERRLHDAQVNAQLKEQLTDAVSEVADGPPSPSDVALGCERLRAYGTDVSGLPACN